MCYKGMEQEAALLHAVDEANTEFGVPLVIKRWPSCSEAATTVSRHLLLSNRAYVVGLDTSRYASKEQCLDYAIYALPPSFLDSEPNFDGQVSAAELNDHAFHHSQRDPNHIPRLVHITTEEVLGLRQSSQAVVLHQPLPNEIPSLQDPSLRWPCSFRPLSD